MNQSDCGTEPEILQYPEFALTDAYGIFSACIPEDYMEKLRQTAKNETARQAVLLAALSGALYAFEETETFRFQAGPEKDIRISMTGEAETPEDLLRQTLTQLIRPETAAAGPDSGEELLVSCNDRGSLYLLCAAQGRTAWIYRRDSYPSIALFGMHRLFTRMLEGILLRRKESLSALREAWNGEELGRQAVHQGERCQTEKRPLCERLRETAAQYPQRPALRDEEREYTFRDIWNGVVKTAAYLQRKNIAKGDRVYLSADYTGVTVICIYALFYLGAAYVPVNESFPEERKAYIAGFCTEGARIDESMKKEIAVLCADAAGEELLPFCGIRETDLPGYVIFTSGTTGTPKGVEITQDWILNMLS